MQQRRLATNVPAWSRRREIRVCRWLAYYGDPIAMELLVLQPETEVLCVEVDRSADILHLISNAMKSADQVVDARVRFLQTCR